MKGCGRKPGAVSKSTLSGTGGLGNKQISLALALPQIIFRDIFIHCVHISVQEYQKKLKMY